MEAPVSCSNGSIMYIHANILNSEEEDVDEYPFPLTLRSKTSSTNGTGTTTPTNGTIGTASNMSSNTSGAAF